MVQAPFNLPTQAPQITANGSIAFPGHKLPTDVKSGLRFRLLLVVITQLILNASAATHTWSGSGVSGYCSEAANWQANSAPAFGETNVVLVFPAGTPPSGLTNDIQNLIVSQLVFVGTNYVLCGTNALTLNSDLGDAIVAANGSNAIVLPMILMATNSFSVLTNSSLTLAGQISGPGAFSLTGGGVLALAPAAGVDNTFTGTTRVLAGTLQMASRYQTDPIFGSRTYAVAISGPLVIGDTEGTAPALLTGMAMSTNTVLTVLGSGRFEAQGGTCASLEGDGFIDFTGTLTFGGDNRSTTFSGRMSGTNDSGLIKIGTGTWTLTGSDLGTVLFSVNEGTLVVNGNFTNSTAVVSPPVNGLSGGTLKGNGALNQFLAYSTVSPGDDRPGRLTVTVLADLDLNSTFAVRLGGTNAGVDYDQLAGLQYLNFFGPCTLKLTMLPGFGGNIGNQYTIVRNLGADPITATFVGLPEGSTTSAANGATFVITYLGGAGNDVVLTQTGLPPQPKINEITRLADGSIQLRGKGFTNATYSVWATAELGTPNWQNIGYAAANSASAILFTDTNAPAHAQRFYRLSW
jgi:autotransporter-associated beta strand protein